MVKRLPLISVGLPVYNGSRYLPETIESILSQTFTDFELVISDNASTDETEDICRSYAAGDSRIRYCRNSESIAPCQNFSRVFELSRGSYFKWAFHDDVCRPAFLEKCAAVLNEHPEVVLCYPRSVFIDENSIVFAEHNPGCDLRSPRVSERVYRYFLESSYECHPLFGLMRKSALEKTSLIPPYPASDAVLLLELALLGPIWEVPDRLFLCREHRDRSCRRFQTYAELIAWLDGEHGASRWQLPRWRLAREFFRTIARANLDFRERMSCYVSAVKWCRWHYRPFLIDLAHARRNVLIEEEIRRNNASTAALS